MFLANLTIKRGMMMQMARMIMTIMRANVMMMIIMIKMILMMMMMMMANVMMMIVMIMMILMMMMIMMANVIVMDDNDGKCDDDHDNNNDVAVDGC